MKTASVAIVLLASMMVLQPHTGWTQNGAGNDNPSMAGLKAAADSPGRSAADKARDQYRHPVETLKFFGNNPDMTVVEIWPGGGWYTEILASYLKQKGTLEEAVPSGENADAYRKKLTDNPAQYGKVVVTELDPPSKLQLAPAGSADMVLTFRNVHNWMRRGYAAKVFSWNAAISGASSSSLFRI